MMTMIVMVIMMTSYEGCDAANLPIHAWQDRDTVVGMTKIEREKLAGHL